MTSDTEVGQIQVSQYRHPKQVEKKGNFTGAGQHPLSKTGRKKS